MAFTMLAYDILGYLIDSKATIIMKAKTVAEMMMEPEIGAFSIGTVYKIVNELWGSGLIAQGVKIGTANSFYITQKGIKHWNAAVGVNDVN